MSKLCVLNVGHSRKSPGAKSTTGITEFEFNDDLARRIEKLVKNVKIEIVYQEKLKGLPVIINSLKPNYILSLHCNARKGKATGTEVLYYRDSWRGLRMAKILQDCLVSFLGLKDRGIKPKTIKDRGGYLLFYTLAPCVICEPFFIDNPNDLSRAIDDLDGLAQAYADAIDGIALL